MEFVMNGKELLAFGFMFAITFLFAFMVLYVKVWERVKRVVRR